jgi:ribosomal protein L44E
MRMWNIDPRLLCVKHLCGEHLEMHMFLGAIRKKKSIKGFINNGLVEVHNIKKRHDELSNEMLKRSYSHKSDSLESDSLWEAGRVNIEQNKRELQIRCKECKERIENERHSDYCSSSR